MGSPFNIVIAGRAARTSTQDRHTRIRCLEAVFCETAERLGVATSTHMLKALPLMGAARCQVARYNSDLYAHCLRLLHMGRNHHRTQQRPQLDPCRLRLRIKMAPKCALQRRDEPQTYRAIMLRLHVVGDVPCCQVHEDRDELRVYRCFLFP